MVANCKVVVLWFGCLTVRRRVVVIVVGGLFFRLWSLGGFASLIDVLLLLSKFRSMVYSSSSLSEYWLS